MTANQQDPYRNFRFLVKMEDHYVAGFSRMSSLSRNNEIRPRAGMKTAVPHQIPGQTDYRSITLERGVTNDAVFDEWVNMVWDYHNTTRDDQHGGTGNKDVSLRDFRKDIVLELYNRAHEKVRTYTIYRAWPSEFVSMPELDSNGTAVAIESLTLENEGWTRVDADTDP